MEKKTLLETYSKRLAVSESVAAKAGVEFDNNRKNAVAMVLDNQNKFMNEALTNSVGTQRADLGDWKRFCLNLATVALPTLIAHDLVIVSPMASFSGYVTYVQYTAGTDKGATRKGDVLNNPFGLNYNRETGVSGRVDADYTGSRVVEPVGSNETTVTAAWTPVLAAKALVNGSWTEEGVSVSGDTITVPQGATKVAYIYDNVKIPQDDIPVVNAEIKSIPLVAKARRVAVYYSQIAAFQAKQDYGFDLGDQLAEKACGQLAYEIDTEITDLLIENAAVKSDLRFNKTVPTGVSKAEHYEAFSEIVDMASAAIYEKTKRFAATYMLCARDIVTILTFIKGFKAANASKINGPYFAGTLNGIKVFVTPNIEKGKFVLGCNGEDMMSSAAVYAPYMAVVPTQLLGYADGGMSQGFSTMYALEMLNKDLLVAGEVVAEAQIVETHQNA